MPSQITPANAGIAPRFHAEHRWPSVAEFVRRRIVRHSVSNRQP